MDYAAIFAISSDGMALERTRVEVAALNLANANTMQAPGQPAYTPLRVVASAGGVHRNFSSLMASEAGPAVQSPAFKVEAANVEPRRIHDPSHPLADERGFVTYPGVDTATEMVALMSATRAYEANVAAMNMARNMALRALEIGGAT